MKKFTKAATFLAGAMMASQSVLAQITPNDLYMGFENSLGGGTADYMINLGSESSLIGSSSVVNLSTYFSLGSFNSSLLAGTNSATIMGGVVGGSNGGSPSDIFVTELRSGGAGTAAVAGSSAPSGLSRAQDDSAYSALTQLNGPAVGTGTLDSSRGWENYVTPTFTTGSFYGQTGVNPESQVGTGSVLYEDLWGTSDSSLSGTRGFTYEGYFTLNLDLAGGGPSLDFTPAPEPSSIMISGAGGIFLLLLRNRLWRRKA